jgi:hypothetical protein
MNSARLAWGLAVCLAVPLCAGCAADQNVFRGQAPSAVVTAPTNGAPPVGTQVAPGSVDPAACPPGCNGACNDGYCQCSPRHYYTSCYDAPYCNNCCNEGPLVYPPNPTPGAVVQYPYYICKGPDDFFHQ